MPALTRRCAAVRASGSHGNATPNDLASGYDTRCALEATPGSPYCALHGGTFAGARVDTAVHDTLQRAGVSVSDDDLSRGVPPSHSTCFQDASLDPATNYARDIHAPHGAFTRSLPDALAPTSPARHMTFAPAHHPETTARNPRSLPLASRGTPNSRGHRTPGV